MGTDSNTYVAIDFDGTIVKHEFPQIGELLPGVAGVIAKLSNVAGVKLILLTMRSDTQEHDFLTQAVDFCRRNGIEFWAVNENPEQECWTSSRKVYAHYYIDDTAVGVPLKTTPGDRPWVDWAAIEDYFDNVFGKNFGEQELNKAQSVTARSTFTKKDTTGFEKQSHGGYARTNSVTNETHFVAPKNFPGAVVTEITNGKSTKYKSRYGALKLDKYPPDSVAFVDIIENMFGDHDTHWLLKWNEEGDNFYAGTQVYEKYLDDPEFYPMQQYLLTWRKYLQKMVNHIRRPSSEADFVENMYELFVSQGYFTEKLAELRVHDVTVGDRSWSFDGRTIKMTQEVFDLADKLLFMKDSMAYVFSYRSGNEAFKQVQGFEDIQLCIEASKFKLLYGLLVQLHDEQMLKGINDEDFALSYMSSVSKEPAKLYKQSIEEFWRSIPFEAIKQYLFSHQSKGEGDPHLAKIEVFCEDIVTGTLNFPAHLDIVQTPFDEQFSNTFFGKVKYAHMPSLS